MIKPITNEWILLAQDDEKVVESLVKEKFSLGIACFHAQQMAEKMLKAFLAEHEKEIPKIHQLERLLGLCKEINNEFKALDKEAVLLSEYYIETRYPGDMPEGIGINEAKEALEAGQKVKNFVLTKLKL